MTLISRRNTISVLMCYWWICSIYKQKWPCLNVKVTKTLKWLWLQSNFNYHYAVSLHCTINMTKPVPSVYECLQNYVQLPDSFLTRRNCNFSVYLELLVRNTLKCLGLIKPDIDRWGLQFELRMQSQNLYTCTRFIFQFAASALFSWPKNKQIHTPVHASITARENIRMTHKHK